MSAPGVPAALSLELVVTRFEGRELSLAWPWPEAQPQVDWASVLLALNLPSQMPQQEALVSFHRGLDPASPALGMEHHSALLQCSLNGQRLPADEWVALEQGDVIELGLFRIEPRWQGAAWAQPAQPAAQAWSDMDLTALASGPVGRSRESTMRLLAKPDAFDDLLQSSAWSEGSDLPSELAATASSAPTPAPAPKPVAKPAPAAMPASLSALSNPSPSPSLSASQPQWDAVVAAPRDEDHLQRWNAQYLRRLQSPLEPLTHDDWAGMAKGSQGPRVDAMDALMQKANDGPEMPQLLGQSDQIGIVLAQLDEHGTSDVMEPPVHTDVMHLFAPAGWRPEQVKEPVPLLSRQEHHGMALDSAVPLQSPQPNNSGSSQS